MAWVTPSLFTEGQLLTAADMNIIQNNLLFLKERPRNIVQVNGVISTTSGTDVAVTGASFNITLEGPNPRILLGYSTTLSMSASGMAVVFTVRQNTTNVFGSIHFASAANVRQALSRTHLSGVLSAGVKTIDILWRVSVVAGTLSIAAGDSLTLWAVEV